MQQKKPSLAAARSIIVETIKQTSDALNKDATSGRGALNATLWQAQQALGALPNYFSQAGQDMLLDTHVFEGKRDGVFVDIGCDDGATFSNTLFLEVFRGWRGLLVDARQAAVAAAKLCRQSPVKQAIVGTPGEAGTFIEVSFPNHQHSGLQNFFDPQKLEKLRNFKELELVSSSVTPQSINALLAEAGIGAIDFVSLDIEGGEMAVLLDFDFEAHPVKAWAIENATSRDDVPKFMSEHGYALVDYLGEDEIYVDAATQAKLIAKMSE